MKRFIFLIFLLVILMVARCIYESFEIPKTWNFTIIRKYQDVEISQISMPQDRITLLIYYPEICGFCLSQIDAVKAELLKIRAEKRKSDVVLVCVISTLDIETLQYYLDEKMNYINEIYIDTEDNISKEFFPDEQIKYPCYFVIQGNKIIEKNKINGNKSLSHIFTLFQNGKI